MKIFNPIYTVSQAYQTALCSVFSSLNVVLVCDLLTRRFERRMGSVSRVFLCDRSDLRTFSLLQEECRRTHALLLAACLDVGSQKLLMSPSSKQVHVCVEMQEFDSYCQAEGRFLCYSLMLDLNC